MAQKSRKNEYGDFQTPADLAEKAVSVLLRMKCLPHSVLEPSCGKGAFINAVVEKMPSAKKIVGLDINSGHLDHIARQKNKYVKIIQADFFSYDWPALIKTLPEPLLIIGNPPWVTSADLGTMKSANLPEKSNFQNRKGFAALTGKSNFDISEWMILKHLEWLQGKKGILAVLCKNSVARKILMHAWKNKIRIGGARIYKINALKYFGAAVEACFFILDCRTEESVRNCEIYESLDDAFPSHVIGHYDGILIANVQAYQKYKSFTGGDAFYNWRSGIKHDCSGIMELEKSGKNFLNGYGEQISLEASYIYPLYKSSDISNGHLRHRKYVLVTQKKIGETTDLIAIKAPKTWRYLLDHSDKLDNRGSSIYKGKPRFSIFGVGDYSFSPWKVAISGFYKKLDFKVVGPLNAKPAMMDDTVNFLPCWSKEEAAFIAELLNSEICKQTLMPMIFWDEKRPITIDILKRLDLRAIAHHLKRENEYNLYIRMSDGLSYIPKKQA